MMFCVISKKLKFHRNSTCMKTFGAVFQEFLPSSTCNFSTALEEVILKERLIQPYSRDPKRKMEPYIKNLFLGKIDPDVFAYPEYDQGSLNVLDEMVSEAERFTNSENISTIDPMEKVSADMILKLKELGIFKLNIPKQYGGLELDYGEMLRIAEIFYRDLSLFHTINVHVDYVSRLLTSFASEEQKEKYLPPLASGDLLIGFALWEKNSGVDVSRLDCSASFTGDSYLLSGTKQWVYNAGIADKFLVFARDKKSSSKEGADSIICLLVDKKAEGISAKSMDTLGVHGLNAWEVTFDKTLVPAENLIGGSGQGIFILQSLLHSKFTLTGACTGFLRDFFNTTLHHSINKETFGKPLVEYDLVKKKLAEAASLIYALESVSYLTAYFHDDFEDPDCEVEATILKVFSTETLMSVVQKCCSILGSEAYLKSKPYERILRDAFFSPLVENSTDCLRMSIALQCLKHVGYEYQEFVMEARNPLYYPQKALKRFVSTHLFNMENAKYKGIIYEHSHPSLESSAGTLERTIVKLQGTIQDLLVRWGAKVEERQMNLERIADIAIDLFVATAVIGRASRALSIGLRNCDTDSLIAKSYIESACERIEHNIDHLERSPYANNDNAYKVITDTLVHERKYCAFHPLTRNY